MSLHSEKGQLWPVSAVWTAALIAMAFAILIPAGRWLWSAPHLLLVFMAFALADRFRLLPERPAAVCLFVVGLMTVAWSVCYVAGIVRHGFL